MAISTAALLAWRVSAATATASPPGWAAVAARALPATVSIHVTKVAVGKVDRTAGDPMIPGERSQYIGSGFIVDPTGIIVTNKHVVGGALWITVQLQDGAEVPATVLAISPLVDLALLKIAVRDPLPTLRLGDGDAIQPGDPVLAVGDPLGVGISLSAGIVSATQRSIMSTPFDDYVQTDAAINHGNSGGPLLDGSGDVIGVNTVLLTGRPNEGSEGVNLAISSNIVADVLRHLLHPEQRPIGWIGLHLQAVDGNLALAMGLPAKSGGVIVTNIDENSPASTAGIHVGDIILRFADDAPLNPQILMRSIATMPIGTMLVMKVWRSGKSRRISLTVRVWPDVSGAPAIILENPRELQPPPPNLGLLLAPITPLARQAYELGSAKGVLVAAVSPMSEAFGEGIRPGIVIEQIDSQPATTVADALQALAQAARQHPVVALLVRWSTGSKWITLHSGRHLEPAGSAGADGAAKGQRAAASDVAPADDRQRSEARLRRADRGDDGLQAVPNPISKILH